MKFFIKWALCAIVLFFIMLWFGCNPVKQASRKLKRANKLIERAKLIDPSIITIDTVIVSDTVYIKAVRVDTIFNDIGDTVIIENEKLTIKYKRDTITNQVFIEGECKADTLIKEIRVPYERLIVKESWLQKLGIHLKWYHKLLFWIFIVIGLLLFIWSKIKPI